jgi:hypothetical protein
MSNLERFRTELDELIRESRRLGLGLAEQAFGKGELMKHLESEGKPLSDEEYGGMVANFRAGYQQWYSKAEAVVRQILPNRLDDFRDLYSTKRSKFDFATYRLADTVKGIRLVGHDMMSTALALYEQQRGIVQVARERLDSALYDVVAVAQADVFDSELDAAHELQKQGYRRPAGVLAGVVMERHLAQVCRNHGINLRKKNPTLNDFNEALKAAGVINLPAWRRHQHRGDLRNKCAHGGSDPTDVEVDDLIAGAGKVTKTVF